MAYREHGPLITIPHKRPKYADVGGALLRVVEDRCRLDNKPCSAEARSAATALQATRDRLETIEAFTPYTAEAAAHEYLRYQAELKRLSLRFDDPGSSLQVVFKWRDAWKLLKLALR